VLVYKNCLAWGECWLSKIVFGLFCGGHGLWIILLAFIVLFFSVFAVFHGNQGFLRLSYKLKIILFFLLLWRLLVRAGLNYRK
jgi:hypothetical protein